MWRNWNSLCIAGGNVNSIATMEKSAAVPQKMKDKITMHVPSHFSHVKTLCDPIDYSLPGASVHGDSKGNTGVGCQALPPGDLPDWEIKPTFLKYPALADGFFTTSTTYNPTIPFWVHTKMNWKQGLEQIFVCLYKQQHYSQKPKDGNNPSV